MLRRNIQDIPYDGRINNQSYGYIDWTADSDKLEYFLNNNLPNSDKFSTDGYLIQQSWMRDDIDSKNITENFRGYPYIPSVSDLYSLVVIVYNAIQNSLSQDLRGFLSELVPWNLRLTNNDTLLHWLNLMAPHQIKAIEKYAATDNKFLIASGYSMESSVAVINQNFNATFTHMRQQVRQIISGTMAGLHFMGSSVCGDDLMDAEINEELCIRWYQFASLTPLFRVQADRIPSTFSQHAMRLMNAIIRR